MIWSTAEGDGIGPKVPIPWAFPGYEEVECWEDRADWFRSPVVKGRVVTLDMEFWALVDTGANVDVVSEQLLRWMLKKIEEEQILSRMCALKVVPLQSSTPTQRLQ